MKLPITDQFLLTVFGFLSEGGDVLRTAGKRKGWRDIGPNLGSPIFEKYRKTKRKYAFNRLVYYLKRNNYIEVKSLKEGKAVLLTKKGMDAALKASFTTAEYPKRKDGQWIMLMFDVPQGHRQSRTLLKSILLNLKYKKFQQSVWVTPYDVHRKTEDLLQYHSLDRYVKIFLIKKL